MIKIYIMFPTYGNSAARMINSMKRYLPDDVKIVQIFDSDIKFVKQDYDIIITHIGCGAYIPSNAFISPKAVISEVTDDVTMSYFNDKDILFSYNHKEVIRLQEAGYNVYLWPRPVNQEIFYPENIDKLRLVMSVCDHFDFVKRVDGIVSKLGGKHLVMKHSSYVMDGELNAEYDWCWAGKDNDRMRGNYCSAKYSMSLCSDYEYRPGKWNCGIEIGVVEALYCGSVPIVLRSKHTDYMHTWLDGLVRWVDPDNFDKEVEEILSGEYVPVTKDQIKMAISRFGAEKVWDTFWQKVREVL